MSNNPRDITIASVLLRPVNFRIIVVLWSFVFLFLVLIDFDRYVSSFCNVNIVRRPSFSRRGVLI